MRTTRRFDSVTNSAKSAESNSTELEVCCQDLPLELLGRIFEDLEPKKRYGPGARPIVLTWYTGIDIQRTDFLPSPSCSADSVEEDQSCNLRDFQYACPFLHHLTGGVLLLAHEICRPLVCTGAKSSPWSARHSKPLTELIPHDASSGITSTCGGSGQPRLSGSAQSRASLESLFLSYTNNGSKEFLSDMLAVTAPKLQRLTINCWTDCHPILPNLANISQTTKLTLQDWAFCRDFDKFGVAGLECFSGLRSLQVGRLSLGSLLFVCLQLI